MKNKILTSLFMIFTFLAMSEQSAFAEALPPPTGVTGVAAGATGAAGTTAAGSAAAGAGAQAVTTTAPGIMDNKAFDKVRELSDNSLGVLVMSVIGATYSGVLYNGAAKQEQDSKDNVAKIDKMIASFKDSYANFCPNGRDNLSEPKCYCYLVTGAQNTNRTKSQTCLDLWAKDTFKLAATAGDYSGVAHAVDAVGCVASSGAFDEKCTCKKFVNSSGVNSCMKTTSITIPSGLGSAFASTNGIQQITSLANSSTSGASNLGTLSTGNLNAIAAKNLNNQILTKLANELPAKAVSLLKVDDKNVGRLAAAVIGTNGVNALANSGMSSAVGVAGSRPEDKKINSLLETAAKKAGLVEVSGGKGLANKKADGKDNSMNFNFAADQGGNPANQTQNFPEAQEKNYNYKNSDISKRPDTSIFEIISNRYIQSGLKRLFDN